jgi:hypothetical protein
MHFTSGQHGRLLLLFPQIHSLLLTFNLAGFSLCCCVFDLMLL